MKKWPTILKILAVVLSLLLAMPCSLLAAAAEKPTTKVKHKSPENYIPGFRVLLDAQIKEKTEVLAARCYFKTKHEENFIFVDMVPKSSKTSDSLYQATLPAPWVGSEFIDYVFVVVNEAKKVDRTELFRMKETETTAASNWKDAAEVKEIPLDKAQEVAERYTAIKKELDKEYVDKLPKWQIAEAIGPIEVLTEFEKTPTRLKGFYDNLAVIKVPRAQRYGALAEDLYTDKQIAALGGAILVADATGASTGGTIEATGAIGIGTIALGAAALGGLAAVAGGGGGGGSGGSGGGGGGSSGGTATNVTEAEEDDFVGAFSATDPLRTFDEYHVDFTFNSGGGGSFTEYFDNVPQAGTLTWSFDPATRSLCI